jgi:DNA-binding cell septation regulator SpoVG
MKRWLSGILFLLALAPVAGATELTSVTHVTELHISTADTCIVLNNVLEISGVHPVSSGTVITCVMPHGSTIEDASLQQTIDAAILSNSTNNSTVAPVSFQVRSLTPVTGENTSVKADVVVVFNAGLVVTCRLVRGENNYWVAWPEGFVIRTTPLRKIIERSIIRKYEERNTP